MTIIRSLGARAGGDSRWMGSRHAIANAHPGTLKAEAFASAPGVEDGVVPSGYPVMEDTEGLYVPFTGEDGSKLRFSIHDRDVSFGDTPTAIHWHGLIVPEFLPVDDFELPAGSPFVTK